jgi:mannose-6-phosphate isomerase-like protein (cupin superfamily)
MDCAAAMEAGDGHFRSRRVRRRLGGEEARMFTRVRKADLEAGAGTDRTVLFQGKVHGSGVSFFLVDNMPGQGPRLHRHPYTETWIVQSGQAVFLADGQEVRPDVGDVVVVAPGTAHKFVNVGPDRLQLVCIHASPELIQDDLESSEERDAFSREAIARAIAAPTPVAP